VQGGEAMTRVQVEINPRGKYCGMCERLMLTGTPEQKCLAHCLLFNASLGIHEKHYDSIERHAKCKMSEVK
jgi:hypothetical protein